jgi:hypothetical protein
VHATRNSLCDQWVCNKNEVSNPAMKDDRKQPDATEKIITTLLWIANVSKKGDFFRNAARMGRTASLLSPRDYRSWATPAKVRKSTIRKSPVT